MKYYGCVPYDNNSLPTIFHIISVPVNYCRQTRPNGYLKFAIIIIITKYTVCALIVWTGAPWPGRTNPGRIYFNVTYYFFFF